MTNTTNRTDCYTFRIGESSPILTLKRQCNIGTTYTTSRTSRKKTNEAKIHAKNHISGSTHH